MTAANPIEISFSSEDDNEADLAERAIRYNIQRYMTVLGISQPELAKVLHVTQGAVSQMVTGYSRLKFKQVFLIAKVFGVSIEDLMDPTYMLQDEALRRRMLEKGAFKRNASTPKEDDLALSTSGVGGTQTRYFVMPETNELALAPREC
ncbi:helix-turn-helix transcriptional regulator [Bifidobacterium pseudocatenulatum]|uniref:helix-turn-helix transcriptional regulator n=1 Tax=Bifidobacterium pseudocatenulatum TaxID=28026 RepID=UPI00189C478B|nr:helix-turn-helix transcriptional regulator [Bifidobacterium pseudocatenulatum]MDB6518480.1 helix-turn-helix transcriptional regulator [Bifidobacterium pseudocatenulatum]MDB6522411.1 helix-turn-helix transcriptional regulator [Bifidobacterium pseudocatenulatum]MDB6524181.1 helix-turn-helix transcriptional regulator [Bifidobacterium pseudocatenulatum]MDB6525507.1 helix-turn-helix transcriptional regulator [Bifidobacterium pseudocatenulatum]MDB6527817.1 helix-turn-helix transcriptional regulat